MGLQGQSTVNTIAKNPSIWVLEPLGVVNAAALGRTKEPAFSEAPDPATMYNSAHDGCRLCVQNELCTYSV